MSQPLFGPNSVAVEIGTSCGSQPGSREGLSRRVHRGRRRRRATRSPDLPRDFGATPRQLRAPASSRGRLRTERLGHRSFPRDFGRELSSGEAAARHAEELDAAKTAVAKKPTICLAFVRQAWAKRRRSCRSDSSGEQWPKKPRLLLGLVRRAWAKRQALQLGPRSLSEALSWPGRYSPSSGGQRSGCCSDSSGVCSDSWGSGRILSEGPPGQAAALSRALAKAQAASSGERRPKPRLLLGDSLGERGPKVGLLLEASSGKPSVGSSDSTAKRGRKARLPLRFLGRKWAANQVAARTRLASAVERGQAAAPTRLPKARKRPGCCCFWGSFGERGPKVDCRSGSSGEHGRKAAARSRLERAGERPGCCLGTRLASMGQRPGCHSNSSGHRSPSGSDCELLWPTLAGRVRAQQIFGLWPSPAGGVPELGRNADARERWPKKAQASALARPATVDRLASVGEKGHPGYRSDASAKSGQQTPGCCCSDSSRLWRHLALHAHAPWSLLSPESFAERAFSRRRRRGF